MDNRLETMSQVHPVSSSPEKGRHRNRFDRTQRQESIVERDRLRRQGQSGLGEGSRSRRSRLILHSQLLSHEVERARESDVRGGMERSPREHRSSAEPRRLRIQRGEMSSGGEGARGDSRARNQEERGLSSPSRDGVSEDGELRDSLAEQIRRYVRKTQSC